MIARFSHILRLQSILWLITAVALSASTPPIAKQGCVDQCGDVKIPYPFGITPNCFLHSFYEIDCRNNSFGIPTAFLKHYNIEIIEINWPGSRSKIWASNHVLTVYINPARKLNASSSNDVISSLDFRESPYHFSAYFNAFMAVGVGDAILKDRKGKIITGCASLCADNNNNVNSYHSNINTTSCFGLRCCHSVLPSEDDEYNGYYFDDMAPMEAVDFYKVNINQKAANSCSTQEGLAAGLVKFDSVGRVENLSKFPTVLTWRITNSSNVTTQLNCVGDDLGQCSCDPIDEGNPYLPNGCQVVQECRKCKKHCMYRFNVLTYGIDGIEFHDGFHCVNPLLQEGPILGFSIGLGSALLLLFCYWLYRVIKRKREAKRKAKYFKRNGGLLLQQHLSSSEGAFDKTKVFRVIELEKATNKFHKSRILGQGGQGTVYKGMLTDGKIVAIKKSNLVDEAQLEHFINELVILSQISHRNVVKVLGCCLETEVPLLIYEFIPNGTLYHLLHSAGEDFHITWKMRLQIAAESADALAYLHSSSSAPIYHRDIKSSNILLDEKYRAKVSDFGTSRAITIEQTHVTTCVMGTYGYLDPEYFQTNQFTEKSDVYSFGVVLVELITGKKPICPTKSGGWIGLAYEFLSHMETSRLSDIVDARVSEEAKEEEFIAVANLARQCLHMSGKMRPSMKEIALVLDGIRSHKLSNLKDVTHEETKCSMITDMSDANYTHFGANTFSIENHSDSSSSIEVQPLMHNTF